MSTETVTKSGRFYCVSVTPDICKTPIGCSQPPLPYNVIGEFSDASNVSPNVKSHSESVILHQRSTIPSVKGDERGTAGGVKSGTYGKQVDTKVASTKHRANGSDLVQVGREVWMNSRNTVGKIFERGAEAARPTLKAIAQAYKDDYSSVAHEVGGKSIEKGAKVVSAATALEMGGAAVSATGVGAPVGIAMEAGGAVLDTVGGLVVGAGAAIEAGATALDHGADYILSGKTPDLLSAAKNYALNTGVKVVESAALGKAAKLGASLEKWLNGKLSPQFKRLVEKILGEKKKGAAAKSSAKSASGGNDGKSKGKKKDKKGDPPSDCCPKDKGPANKPVRGRKPVHFGTGQEILEQTDFVLDAAIPIVWTRCYRSGAECEDWGLFGARWASAYTTSLSLVEEGIVYHDETGRGLRLPLLALGATYDCRKEGFILSRPEAEAFTLTWRDGAVDRFVKAGPGWLPHGYDGVNMMLTPSTSIRAQRYELVRSEGRDGRGLNVERLGAAAPGEALLRISTDDGIRLEALRADEPLMAGAQKQAAFPPRIGCVEQVLEDGSRIRHVVYHYASERGAAPAGAERTDAMPPRYNLVRQVNLLAAERSYRYSDHLLCACTDYTGFAQKIGWISLSALRARWEGNPSDNVQLAALYPITLDNSYQARATFTQAEDGSELVVIDYRDIDTTRVDDCGRVLEYVFDANWLCTEVRRVVDGVAKSLGRREWDCDAMLLVESTPAGSTRYSYDDAGNLTGIEDALGHHSSIAYDEHNDPVSVTDALGNITRRNYDELGRLTSITDALGHVTSYCYNDKGWLVCIVDARGGEKHFHYDCVGRVTTMVDCSGYASYLRYDAWGRLTTMLNALEQEVRYDYDRLGRVIRVVQPDLAQEQYGYDAEGRLLEHIDANGARTSYRYNGQGMPVERIDAKGQKLQYRYDRALQLAELINANGESYRLAYNAEGALASETGFDGKVTEYHYDHAGQLIASACNGLRSDLSRDILGQLISKTTADGTVRFAYDALGRLTAVRAAHAEQHFAYDALGQLLDERSAYFLSPQPLGVLPNMQRTPDASFLITHAYDELGNRIRTTLPNGRRIDTLRYGSGHWHGVLWQGRPLVDLERDRLHREKCRMLGGAGKPLKARRSYDLQSRLSSMIVAPDSKDNTAFKLRERHFKYDLVGNLTSIEHGWHDANHTLGKFQYTYDVLGQLLSAEQPGLREVFAFDPAGNLLDLPAASATPAGHATGEQAVAASGTAQVVHDQITTFGGTSYNYDAQGNLISTRSQRGYASGLDLRYDAENRLIHAVRSGMTKRHTAKYFYDAFSRRIAKEVTEERWTSGGDMEAGAPAQFCCRTTLFVWDGDVMVQELRADKTVNYLYEPDSFVPLARIESQAVVGQNPMVVSAISHTGQMECDAAGAAASVQAAYVHFPHVHQWDLPSDRTGDQSERERLEAEQEACHSGSHKQRQQQADNTAASDRVDYYICDQIGTPRELVSDRGRAMWFLRAKAWGRSVDEGHQSEIFEVNQTLRFQGQFEDDETGLFYNRYRYYEPDLGRYINLDPIGLLGGLNQYIYARNSTGWIDPFGLTARCGKGALCDPCAGKNPAAEARATQGIASDPNNPYVGEDVFINIVLKKGTVLYSLSPGGTPGFAVMNHVIIKSGGDPVKYHDLTQVTPGRNAAGIPRAMRNKVQVFRINQDICAAKGSAKANKQFGVGGATQYYISPSDFAKLTPGKIRGI